MKKFRFHVELNEFYEIDAISEAEARDVFADIYPIQLYADADITVEEVKDSSSVG